MSMFTWLRRSPRRTDLRPKCRPHVEMLENRWVPALIAGQTATQNFVDQVYRDILHRAPDSAGLQGWSQQIDSGRLTRQEVVLQIEGSTEGQQTLVNDVYTRLLRRSADAAGENGWVQFLQNGHSTEDLEAQIAASQEYLTTQGGGTTTGYITALYRDFLARTPSTAEIDSWTSQATTDRLGVAHGIISSQEGRTDEVHGFYTSYLRRTGEASGVSYWTDFLVHGNLDRNLNNDHVPSSVQHNDDEILVSYFLSSQEYFQDAQTLPPTSFATIPGPA